MGPNGPRCDMCLKRVEEVHHLPLYVFGSEGVYLCHDCEMKVCEYIYGEAIAELHRRKNKVMKRKETNHV